LATDHEIDVVNVSLSSSNSQEIETQHFVDIPALHGSENSSDISLDSPGLSSSSSNVQIFNSSNPEIKEIQVESESSSIQNLTEDSTTIDDDQEAIL